MTTNENRHRVHERRDRLTAAQALAALVEVSATPAIGFGYRPEDAAWFRLEPDGTPTDRRGTPFPLAGVFQLRAFNPTHELRWRTDHRGVGTAILVSDQISSPQRRPQVHGGYDRLVWGTVTSHDETGWLTLYDPRIGTLDVPFDGPAPVDRRVWLRAVEYQEEDQHGNVSIVDERLTALVSKNSTGGAR